MGYICLCSNGIGITAGQLVRLVDLGVSSVLREIDLFVIEVQ